MSKLRDTSVFAIMDITYLRTYTCIIFLSKLNDNGTDRSNKTLNHSYDRAENIPEKENKRCLKKYM